MGIKRTFWGRLQQISFLRSVMTTTTTVLAFQQQLQLPIQRRQQLLRTYHNRRNIITQQLPELYQQDTPRHQNHFYTNSYKSPSTAVTFQKRQWISSSSLSSLPSSSFLGMMSSTSSDDDTTIPKIMNDELPLPPPTSIPSKRIVNPSETNENVIVDDSAMVQQWEELYQGSSRNGADESIV